MTAKVPAGGSGQNDRARLAFLLETAELEAQHLNGTCARLFALPFTPERAATIRSPIALAEAVQAAHEAVPMLSGFVWACSRYSQQRKLV